MPTLFQSLYSRDLVYPSEMLAPPHQAIQPPTALPHLPRPGSPCLPACKGRASSRGYQAPRRCRLHAHRLSARRTALTGRRVEQRSACRYRVQSGGMALVVASFKSLELGGLGSRYSQNPARSIPYYDTILGDFRLLEIHSKRQ